MHPIKRASQYPVVPSAALRLCDGNAVTLLSARSFNTSRMVMLKAGARPGFIVHSRVDPRIDYQHSERLARMAQDAGANATVWLVNKGGHLMTPAYYGQEFEDKMVGCFRSALGK
jgi:hypothetical protein